MSEFGVPQPYVTASVLTKIKRLAPSLRPAERRVAEFIMAEASDIIYMPITEVASGSETSDSTVIRFCRRLGLDGFQDLKIALARDLVSPTQNIHGDIQPDDDLKTALEKAFSATVQAVRDTYSSLDFNTFEQAVQRLARARKVVFYGVGTSGLSALDGHYKFMRIGFATEAFVEGHVQAISASRLHREDVVVALSHSGSTRDIVETLQMAKRRGCFVLVITNFPNSPVGNLADVVLLSAAEETPFGSGGVPSITAQLALIDALFVAVALESREQALAYLELTGESVKSKKY